MNQTRREKLRQAIGLMERAETIVESVYDEEMECLENTPENLQSSEKYTIMENAIDALDDAIENIREAETNINIATE